MKCVWSGSKRLPSVLERFKSHATEDKSSAMDTKYNKDKKESRTIPHGDLSFGRIVKRECVC